MLEYKLGYFARSLCGHDKNRLYMIVDIDGDMIGLSDGRLRPLSRPKYKKKKHIQLIRSEKTAAEFETIKRSGDPDQAVRAEVSAREKPTRDQED